MTVIVVSGAPGTGKSAVASALAADLGWPLLALDTIKEALADLLGLGDEDWSFRLGDAAAEIVFRLSAQFPAVVAEGWWRRERRDRARAEFAGAVEVFCYCEPKLASSRVGGRLDTGRHPIHRDMINRDVRKSSVTEHAAALAGAVPPLGLGAALIKIDTGQPGASARAFARVTAALGR